MARGCVHSRYLSWGSKHRFPFLVSCTVVIDGHTGSQAQKPECLGLKGREWISNRYRSEGESNVQGVVGSYSMEYRKTCQVQVTCGVSYISDWNYLHDGLGRPRPLSRQTHHVPSRRLEDAADQASLQFHLTQRSRSHGQPQLDRSSDSSTDRELEG